MNLQPEIFIGIGAQKAGTSWIERYLREHPQVGFSPIKELHYFDAAYKPEYFGGRDRRAREMIAKLVQQLPENPDREQVELIRCWALRLEMVSDQQKYLDYFRLLAQPKHKLVGEITPAYAALDEPAFAAMKALTGTRRIIFILRDPVDRVWSHMRYRQRKGVDPYKALEDALTRPQVVLRTDYARTLRELYKVFGHDEVCVLFYENLFAADTHEQELTRLVDFLGIEYRPGDRERRINETHEISSLTCEWEQRILSRFEDVYRYVADTFPETVPRAWTERVSS